MISNTYIQYNIIGLYFTSPPLAAFYAAGVNRIKNKQTNKQKRRQRDIANV